jgi:hypothetical protein
VKEALAAIGTGGYAAGVALVGALLSKAAGPIPLARLELIDRLARSDDVLARLPADTRRRIQAEQAVVAELEPEAGLRSLPKLLPTAEERQRVLALLDEVAVTAELTPEQRAALARVRGVLDGAAAERRPGTPDGAGRQPATAT